MPRRPAAPFLTACAVAAWQWLRREDPPQYAMAWARRSTSRA